MSVEIQYSHGLGNNLFQYAFARLVAERLGRELVCVPDPVGVSIDWESAFTDAPQRIPGRVIDYPQVHYTKIARPLWDEHGIDLDYLDRAARDRRIVLRGFFQRAEYYLPDRERIRRWFAPREAVSAIDAPDPADVIVHVRRGDYFAMASVLAMRYYEDVLDALQPTRVFVTGLGIDDDVRAALRRFEPHWLDLEPLAAVRTIARFNRIVGANSTFSWWAAFLSDASEVYFPRPVSGLWSRETTRIALELSDPRVHYIDGVEVDEWRPFTPRWNAIEVGGSTPTDSRRIVELSVAGRPCRLQVDERLVPLCVWLAGRFTPFGYADAAHVLSELPRPAIVDLLKDLVRVEALAVSDVASRHFLNMPVG